MTQPHESDFASQEDYFEIGTIARMHHPMKQEEFLPRIPVREDHRGRDLSPTHRPR